MAPSGPGGNGERGADILAECRRHRVRALRRAVISGVLIVAVLVGTVAAAARGAYHGAIVFLIPVIVVINLVRLAQCLMALGKIRRAEHLVRDAQARVSRIGGFSG
jgi:hypothetical protein